jgi:putative spermidine/putrescine transport system ATP-binding protein
MTAAVLFENVSRHFGAVKAVDAVDLEIVAGEFFAMLGPSGSGKTTCLRLMAGFEQPTGGHIEIFGETAEGVPPYRRSVNTVFQDYALFPHLSILDNVAYGLMVKGVGKEERRKAAEDALAMVKLPGYGTSAARASCPVASASVWRWPARSSTSPRCCCSTNRLGALDLKLREQMQEELKTLQKSLGITFVFVTHDQGEALSMADRIAVFNDGKIQQLGTPEDIYKRPQTRFVADFVGSSNVSPAPYAPRLGVPAKAASLRPEAIAIGTSWAEQLSLPGVVTARSFPRRLQPCQRRLRGERSSSPAPLPCRCPISAAEVQLAFSHNDLHLMEEA